MKALATNLTLPSLALFLFAFVLQCICFLPTARAESAEWNLHIDLDAAGTFYGALGPEADPSGKSEVHTFGGIGFASLDYQLAPPLALELIVGGGAFGSKLPGGPFGYFGTGLGVRMRFEDNQEGYANEEGGDDLGNAWWSAHAGYHYYDGSEFGLDVAGGYEFSVLHPMQLGVHVRGIFLFTGDSPDNKVDIILTAGVNASFELSGRVNAVDTDGDGLSDEREKNRWRTNERDPDTDHDGLNDGIEVTTGTDPNKADTDNDGVGDGTEDVNKNGGVDGAESDPRKTDTDNGGAPDGWEIQNNRKANDPSDDDQDEDKVPDHLDQCLGTAKGTTVDARGCAEIKEHIVLEGIFFNFGSAEITEASTGALMIALQILKDNPDVTVEIEGHTDNVGTPQVNERLSRERAQSVQAWLVSRGIARTRMTVKGYGATRPRAEGDTEEARARNRRIEFATKRN